MSKLDVQEDVARVERFRQAGTLVQCRSCGFEPPGDPPPERCPKCHGRAWEGTRTGRLWAARPPVPENP